MYGTETWILPWGGVRKTPKALRCGAGRRMEKICRTDRMKNKVSYRVQEKINILHAVK